MGFYYDGKLYNGFNIIGNKVSSYFNDYKNKIFVKAAKCLTMKNWNHLDKLKAKDWLKVG